MNQDTYKLLSQACVRWEDIEYGAPAIDGKRPYGNSDVEQDIAEILDWPGADDLTYEQCVNAQRLHLLTEQGLQEVLRALDHPMVKKAMRDAGVLKVGS